MKVQILDVKIGIPPLEFTIKVSEPLMPGEKMRIMRIFEKMGFISYEEETGEDEMKDKTIPEVR